MTAVALKSIRGLDVGSTAIVGLKPGEDRMLCFFSCDEGREYLLGPPQSELSCSPHCEKKSYSLESFIDRYLECPDTDAELACVN